MFQMPLDNRGRTTALYRSLQRPPLLSPPPPQAKTIGGIRVGAAEGYGEKEAGGGGECAGTNQRHLC
jgi:hypothetical protein